MYITTTYINFATGSISEFLSGIPPSQMKNNILFSIHNINREVVFFLTFYYLFFIISETKFCILFIFFTYIFI